MIKHFCDICGNEMTNRLRVSITAKEVCGEGYLRTVGKNLMDTDYECCDTCYNELVDIVISVDEGKRLSLFDKLREFIRENKEG